MVIDENLKQYATDRQWEYYTLSIELGSGRNAAASLGISPPCVNRAIKAIRNKAARHGYSPEHDMSQTVPDGFQVKGVSTLYDKDGNKQIQWVKSTVDREQQEELMKEAIKAFTDTLKRYPAIKPPKQTQDSLLAAYVISDHHVGMLAWHEETGDDYDLNIAEDLLLKSTSHLVNTLPSCDTALITVLGDYMHYDSYVPQTPQSKNILDADSRFPKMVRCAIKLIRATIDTALKHHNNVNIIIETGNHDTSSSVFLRECVANVYENEPRINVDVSPKKYHFFRYGNSLIGTHHGDKVKMQDLPLLMATDNPDDWGQTKYRYWWTGHIHHDSVKEHPGCKVESFRVLAPKDAWHSDAGYRSMRDMKAIVIHKEFGEVARHIVNPDMLK